MKKSLITFIAILLIVGCSTLPKEKGVFFTTYQETNINISALLDDDVLAVEVTVIDDLSTKNSVVIREEENVEAVYSLRKVNVDKVLKGSLSESSDKVIIVVDSAAEIDNQMFEVYGGAYENRLMKNQNYILYLKYHSDFDVYEIYDFGKAKVNLSNNVDHDVLSFVTQLYFYNDIVLKEMLKTVRYEGISAWSSDLYQPMTITVGNEETLTFDYMYNEANDRSYFVLPSGIFYSIEGDLFMYNSNK